MAKRVRPIGHMVNYTIPGHVIGGSEPRSWKAKREAEAQARFAQNRNSSRPPAADPTISAKYAGRWHWCRRPHQDQ